jgi:hypothetical protein
MVNNSKLADLAAKARAAIMNDSGLSVVLPLYSSSNPIWSSAFRTIILAFTHFSLAAHSAQPAGFALLIGILDIFCSAPAVSLTWQWLFTTTEAQTLSSSVLLCFVAGLLMVVNTPLALGVGW